MMMTLMMIMMMMIDVDDDDDDDDMYKLVMIRYTSDSLIILTYPKTRHSESMK